MADKFYHQQPCFCMPCRVLKDSGEAPRPRLIDKDKEPVVKKSRGRKKS